MEVHRNFSLKKYNSFGIDAHAAKFCAIHNEKDLTKILKEITPPLFVLGGGSNLLLTQDLNATVLHNQIQGIEIVFQNENIVQIKVGGGVVWDDCVSWAVQKSYGGIENLSLIPGSVGAAPIQNIGAYGVELKDVFVSLDAIDLTTGEKRTFDKQACAFGYRNSVFKHTYKGQYFISYITLELQKEAKLNLSYGAIKEKLKEQNIIEPTVLDVSNTVKSIRRMKLPDPAELGNSGSFFKNPIVTPAEFQRLEKEFSDLKYYAQDDGNYKIPAGWLIEQCGWKGKRVGNTGSYAKQALVIVNYGDATGEEVEQHALNVKKSVFAKFGILLEAEVNIL